MITRASIKKRCKDCYQVMRCGINYIYCKGSPRHKQRQGYHKKSGVKKGD